MFGKKKSELSTHNIVLRNPTIPDRLKVPREGEKGREKREREREREREYVCV